MKWKNQSGLLSHDADRDVCRIPDQLSCQSVANQKGHQGKNVTTCAQEPLHIMGAILAFGDGFKNGPRGNVFIAMQDEIIEFFRQDAHDRH